MSFPPCFHGWLLLFLLQKVALGISLLVFMASFISSPRLRNAQSYKLLGFLGDFASQGLIIFINKTHTRRSRRDLLQIPQTQFVEFNFPQNKKVCGFFFENSTSIFDKRKNSTNLLCGIFFPQSHFVEFAKVKTSLSAVEI